MDRKKYLNIFAREAEELLGVLRQGSLDMEQSGVSSEILREMLRSAHTLKGSARLLSLESLEQVVHALEDLLKDLEDGRREITPGLADLLLLTTDAIAGLVEQAGKGGESGLDLKMLLIGLESGILPEGAIKKKEVEASARRTLPRGTVRTSVERLDRLGNQAGELLILRRMLGEKARAMNQGLFRLEAFLGRMRRKENYQQLKSILKDINISFSGMEEDLLSLNYLGDELYDEAMGLRMMPLSSITEELTRMVRDLGREQGKELQFTVSGDQVELDRQVIEAAKPMLMHMLRNAIDHGLESPGERLACGKTPAGRIGLSATYEGSGVRLRLSDDGRGIDPQKVRSVAMDRRLATKEEVDSLCDEEAVYLILRPGFTTREKVTDLSGRGVGMDVVKTQIDKIKGNLAIRSTVGQGTVMSLSLPLTQAVINAMILECESETYAVPLHYVSEILRISDKDVLSEGGRDVIRVRGTTLPLVALRQILGIAPLKGLAVSARYSVLVLNFREQQLACLVSRTLSVQDLVVKTLGKQVKSVEFFSGATILGDGSPALILSVPDLFHRGFGQGGGLKRELEPVPVSSRGRILVVDDSITTRAMEKNILESNGYEVEVAISGPEALELVKSMDFDLVVSDVEMPGMDGFELTACLRSLEKTTDIPVVIVTSLTSDEHRRRGLEVGAQAYIVKAGFDQSTLLDTIDSLIG